MFIVLDWDRMEPIHSRYNLWGPSWEDCTNGHRATEISVWPHWSLRYKRQFWYHILFTMIIHNCNKSELIWIIKSFLFCYFMFKKHIQTHIKLKVKKLFIWKLILLTVLFILVGSRRWMFISNVYSMFIMAKRYHFFKYGYYNST